MSVCTDKVCEAKVCGGECEGLIPSMCGNSMPITMASCYTSPVMPNSKCLYTEIYMPVKGCEENEIAESE